MPLGGEPENDERVEKHGQRGGPLNCLAAPALRFLKPQALLAVAECDFDTPSHGVPTNDLLGRCLMAR